MRYQTHRLPFALSWLATSVDLPLPDGPDSHLAAAVVRRSDLRAAGRSIVPSSDGATVLKPTTGLTVASIAVPTCGRAVEPTGVVHRRQGDKYPARPARAVVRGS